MYRARLNKTESPIFVICVFFVSEGNVLDLKKNIFFSTVNYRRIMHDVGVGWGGLGVGGGGGEWEKYYDGEILIHDGEAGVK